MTTHTLTGDVKKVVSVAGNMTLFKTECDAAIAAGYKKFRQVTEALPGSNVYKDVAYFYRNAAGTYNCGYQAMAMPWPGHEGKQGGWTPLEADWTKTGL